MIPFLLLVITLALAVIGTLDIIVSIVNTGEFTSEQFLPLTFYFLLFYISFRRADGKNSS